MLANRESYGLALRDLAAKMPNLVVLDADLAKATFTDTFRQAYPERFIDCGIAEANMMGVAAGLSTVGYVPFVSSFAMFAALRAGEQFRNSVCYPNLNVKVVATHAGVDCGADGATHQALEDIALIRAIPNVVVMVPSDHVSTAAIVRTVASHQGPCYVRLGRDKNKAIYNSNESFEIGKSKTLIKGDDAAILACGSMVEKALDAAKLLIAQGIHVRVVDMYSIKPIDTDAIVSAAQTGCIVTCEDHQIAGGLGSAVCEVTASVAPCKVARVGMQDSFGKSASAQELYSYFGMDVQDIVRAVLSLKSA